MIVNLAVADGYHAALRVRHWLVGLIRETTNSQARRTEDRKVGVNLAGGVRPTMRQGSEHCLHSDMTDFARRELRKGYVAADAAHSRTFLRTDNWALQHREARFESIRLAPRLKFPSWTKCWPDCS